MTKIHIKIALGVLLFLIFLKWINLLEAVKYLSRLNLTEFAFGCLLMVLSQTLRAVRFYYLAIELDIVLNFKENLLVHLITSLLGATTPGKLGEGGKVFFFQNNRKELGFCFILEKLADLTVLIVFASLGSVLFKDYLKEIIVFSILLLFTVLLLLRIDKVFNYVAKKKPFEDKWFEVNLKKVSSAGFLLLLITTGATWLSVVFACYLYAASLGIHLPLSFVVQMIGISTSASLISGSPGGLGVKEFITTKLLHTYLGVDYGLAGIFSLLATFGNYATFSVTALCGYYLYSRQAKSSRIDVYQEV